MKAMILLFLATAFLAFAEEKDTHPQTTLVQAVGEAQVETGAGISVLYLRVTTTGRSAESAREKNAEQCTSLIAHLHDLLGKDGTIRTLDYSVGRYRDYSASNSIEVRLSDAALAGKVIDLAAKENVPAIRGASQRTDDPSAYVEALKQATVRARANAEAIATALGMHTVRVVSVRTDEPPLASAQPGIRSNDLAMMRVPTPVEPGTALVHTRVTLILEAAP